MNIGEDNVYTFSVDDTNDFNVTVEGGLPDGGIFSDEGAGNYIFTWTPGAIPNDGLTFIAMDANGAASIHSPTVLVCACFNGGECTELGVLSTDNPVITLTCLCDEGIYTV